MSLTVGSSGGPSAEMNVTPLIDVLLVLLIIFLLIIPNSTVGEAADIPLPEQKRTTQAAETAIVVELHESAPGELPRVTINQQKASWEGLEARLEQIYKQRAQKTAFLKSDSEIDFEYVAIAFDVMHRAGVAQVGLMAANR
jgi:biopolymer transport protein ExbD